MSYLMNSSEILQTIQMIDQQHLDVRTVTMGISLLDCAADTTKRYRNVRRSNRSMGFPS